MDKPSIPLEENRPPLAPISDEVYSAHPPLHSGDCRLRLRLHRLEWMISLFHWDRLRPNCAWVGFVNYSELFAMAAQCPILLVYIPVRLLHAGEHPGGCTAGINQVTVTCR